MSKQPVLDKELKHFEHAERHERSEVSTERLIQYAGYLEARIDQEREKGNHLLAGHKRALLRLVLREFETRTREGERHDE